MVLATAVAGAMVGFVGGAVGSEGSPWVVLAVAVLGSSATAAAISAYQRRRSGEGPASAARDLSDALGGLVDATEQLSTPLQLRIVALAQEVADLTTKLADARVEVHEARREAAQAAAQLEVARSEVNELRRQAQNEPHGRRATDKPTVADPS